MKLSPHQIEKIHAKTGERAYAINRMKELKEETRSFATAKVIFTPTSGRSFVEEARAGTDLGVRLIGTMLIYFQGVVERCEQDLASMGVEIEDVP